MASPFHIISNVSAMPVPSPTAHPRPDWLRVKFFGGERYQDLKRIMRTLDLHTVCESARCPNMGECWEHGTATFMILGDICTRACGFCAVPSGKPVGPPDEERTDAGAWRAKRRSPGHDAGPRCAGHGHSDARPVSTTDPRTSAHRSLRSS